MPRTSAGELPARPREGREQAPILVVDDDPQTLRYVRDTLAAAGYSSLVTGDPREVADLVSPEISTER